MDNTLSRTTTKNILNGISRQLTIELARKLGINMVETDILKDI
ncbi:MAG: hypothetical protein AB1798_14880 [Spirochaetota bacterium]